MNRVTWSVEGIEPSVREKAEAAARRAGMSLEEWISVQVGEAPPQFRPAPPSAAAPPPPAMPDRDAQEVAQIHQRLDSIARQIETISRPAPRAESGAASLLNDAISRLDERLMRINETPAPQPQPQPAMPEPQRQAAFVDQAAASVYRASPPLSPGSLDFAIAEITARQNELDAPPSRIAPRYAPPTAPAMPAMAPPPPSGPDFSSLERQLVKITSQIDALRRPDDTEQSIAAFRGELADIRKAITEALPRRAIESIESEIKSLARRIDDTRQSGIDAGALAGVERALGEIREALRSLTPAEQLAGYDEAIRNLGSKLDLIVRSNDDPGTIGQLESAISALRGIVSNVASNETLAQLSDNVHTLSSKLDQLAHSDSRVDFAALEQRISALTSALQTREPPAGADSSDHIEGALRALTDRLDRLPVGNDSASAFAHLEQRVSYLLERMEAASDPRGGNLGRVEEGLQDVLRHLERQTSSFAALADVRSGPVPQIDSALVDTIKRELSDIRFGQSETERHTQDSLEAVHNTLGHVVDRLAMIEGDLRTARAAPPAPAPEPVRQWQAPAEQAAPAPRPEMPNPAAVPYAAAPRQFVPVQPEPAPSQVSPRAIHDILDPPRQARQVEAPAQARPMLDPALPPDHPLEPGTRPGGRIASPSERIAASESAINDIAPAAVEPVSTSSFIAAARRAAQAAASAAAPADKPKRGAAQIGGDASAKPGSTIGSKIRSLLVGASVVVIVLGTFKMAMNLLDGGSAPPPVASAGEAPVAPLVLPPADKAPLAPAPAPAPAMPSMTSPTPLNRQSMNAPAPVAAAPVEVASAAPADVTGAIPPVAATTAPASPQRAPTPIAIPAGERLPDSIGGPQLRAAALRGEPAAAYEIGVRYAEGKTAPANYDEAAKWYDRAAQAGVVPAIFRIGTLYEKGLGLKKDLDAARRYYIQAAERGNAKAMHNLAVLEADGGSKGANYKSASEWFRKAADRGVADSQFNLGILYARGIGVEQNLAESYKWFSLAAAQGDADSGRKRDDVAKRLDPQSLSAAKLAIQTFTPEPQPDDAVNAGGPAGGWDAATSASAAKPTPAAKPAMTKRAAR